MQSWIPAGRARACPEPSSPFLLSEERALEGPWEGEEEGREAGWGEPAPGTAQWWPAEGWGSPHVGRTASLCWSVRFPNRAPRRRLHPCECVCTGKPRCQFVSFAGGLH